MLFKGDTVQNFANIGIVPTITAGIQAALTTAAHTAVDFQLGAGGPTFIYDHVGTGLGVSPTDSMVEFIGLHPITALSATTHALTLA